MAATSPHFFELEETRLGTAAVLWREDASGPRIVRICLPAPVGTIRRALRRDFPGALRKSCGVVDRLRRGIGEFLSGRHTRFDTSAFDMDPIPPYHRKVLAELERIPRGRSPPTAASHREPGLPAARGPQARAAGKTPSPSSTPATGSSGRTDRWVASAAGSPSRRPCWRWKGCGSTRRGKRCRTISFGEGTRFSPLPSGPSGRPCCPGGWPRRSACSRAPARSSTI